MRMRRTEQKSSHVTTVVVLAHCSQPPQCLSQLHFSAQSATSSVGKAVRLLVLSSVDCM